MGVVGYKTEKMKQVPVLLSTFLQTMFMRATDCKGTHCACIGQQFTRG